MTNKAETFIYLVAQGMNLTEAYKIAGYSCKGKRTRQRAYELKIKYKEEIAALKQDTARLLQWERLNSIKAIRDVIINESMQSKGGRSKILKAVQTINKMCGYDKPETSNYIRHHEEPISDEAIIKTILNSTDDETLKRYGYIREK